MKKKLGVLFLALFTIIIAILVYYILSLNRFYAYIPFFGSNLYFNQFSVISVGLLMVGLCLLFGVLFIKNPKISRWILITLSILVSISLLLMLIPWYGRDEAIIIAICAFPPLVLVALLFIIRKNGWAHITLIVLTSIFIAGSLFLVGFVAWENHSTFKDRYIFAAKEDDPDKKIVLQIASNGFEGGARYMYVYTSIMGINFVEYVNLDFFNNNYLGIPDGLWNKYNDKGEVIGNFEVSESRLVLEEEQDVPAEVDQYEEEGADKMVSYLEGPDYYLDSSIPRERGECIRALSLDSTETIQLKLHDMSFDSWKALYYEFHAEERKSEGNGLAINRNKMFPYLDSVIYQHVLNKQKAAQWEYTPKLSYLWTAYSSYLSGNRFYYRVGNTKGLKTLSLISALSRDKDQVAELFRLYEPAIYCMISPEIYKETGMQLYVKTLITTYRELHHFPKDYDGLMVHLYDVAGSLRDEVYEGYAPYVSDQVLQDFGSTIEDTDYTVSGTICWLYSFWARRHHEGNDKAVYDILRKIDRHYSAEERAGKQSLKLKGLLTELPEMSLPAKITVDSETGEEFLIDDWGDWFPKSLKDETIANVYAISKIEVNDEVSAVMFSIEYRESEDDEDVYYTRSRKVIFLCDDNGNYLDHLTVAIGDYGMGYSIINSEQKITYIYSSEMEGIAINHSSYLIDYDVFENQGYEEVYFNGNKQGYNASGEYLNLLENKSGAN